jgi:hypothetical protein
LDNHPLLSTPNPYPYIGSNPIFRRSSFLNKIFSTQEKTRRQRDDKVKT